MKTILCDTFHFPYVTFGDTWELLVPFRPQLKFHGGPKKKIYMEGPKVICS